jgi:hypothetical protein
MAAKSVHIGNNESVLLAKRSIASAAAALLVAGVPAAVAAVRSGTFSGKTDRGQPVQFRVTSDKQLVHFRFSELTMRCSDRSMVPVSTLDSGAKKLTITEEGKFAFRVTYSDGGHWTARGTIKGRRARGRIRLHVDYGADNQPEPNGRIHCDSGNRRFTTKRR